MTKIKLTNGTIINVSTVEVVNGTLKITTAEHTVEELAKLFGDKNKTNLIVLMTESGKECGYKMGFTSFAGINYDADGNKTVELFQPKDVTEARIANAEATANMAKEITSNTNDKLTSIETDITDVQLALVELYEMGEGGNE